MKTTEAAVIFPITLMIMVNLILLSFQLHDMVLYKNASYKFLICNGPNSTDYNVTNNDDLEPLASYIYNHSLSGNYLKLSKEENVITINTANYEGSVESTFYDKCELLRKCTLVGDFINQQGENEQ